MFFDRFRRKPKPIPEGDEWITVPFRVAEAARVSIYTIASRPELPDSIRWWIAQWLTNYNSYLVNYMKENYGPDIFPILDDITHEVMPESDEEYEEEVDEGNPEPGSETWELWEQQLDDLEGQ